VAILLAPWEMLRFPALKAGGPSLSPRSQATRTDIRTGPLTQAPGPLGGGVFKE